MAKYVLPAVLDAALDEIRDNCTRMVICDGQPTTFAEANNEPGDEPAGLRLADVTMADTDFTKGNGDVSGRKLTVAQKTGVEVDVSGDGDHVALLDVTGTRLLYVTTATEQALTDGNTMTFNAWDIEIEDPA